MLRTAAKVGLAALGLLLLLPLVGYGVLCKTPWGRERVRLQANRLVSGAMAGDLEIAHLDELDLPRIRARGVKISAPDGSPCIEVERIEAWLDLDAIIHGSFAWDRALIQGGIVHVLEDRQGRINMEEAFKESPSSAESSSPRSARDVLDLRTMVTSDMVLVIGGGSLPRLRMEDLRGTMRVHVLPDHEVELRFDEYSGDFVEGLPTGRLTFRDVKGKVQTEGKRLLRFEGQGQSEGKPLQFVLDIHTEPETEVEIDAHFAERSAESASTRAIAAWSKFAPGLDLRMHREPVLERRSSALRAR